MTLDTLTEQFDFLDRLKDGLVSNGARFSFHTAPMIFQRRFNASLAEAIRIVSGWASTYEPELSPKRRAAIFLETVMA